MGYGRSVSRFVERKRVVKDKDVGPLIQTEMTRCIHCTRCIRFLDEIAGTHEMGGAGRGDRLEVGTVVQNSIDSELSGNVIDLCPVGALTNKPFRFAARAWELMARPSIALHDGVGSHLYYHTRRGDVLRAVPRDEESLNENWLADRDRFSLHGLYAEDRVLAPQVKQDGEWRTVSWDEAIDTVASILKDSAEAHGADQTGMLMSPSATTEEYFLAQALLRGLGSGNIDHRLRQGDFSDDPASPAAPVFEMPVADIATADVILLAGCNPREEAPIVGHRVRQAWRKGAQVSAYNPLDWSFHFETSLDAIVAPQNLVDALAALAGAVERRSGTAAPDELRGVIDGAAVSEAAEALAERLAGADRGLVLLGQSAQAHGEAAWLRSLARYIAGATGAALDVLTHGGNSRGAWLAGAVPHRGPGGTAAISGLDAAAMVEAPRKTYLLWGVEPGFDSNFPSRCVKALHAADKVITFAAFAASGLYEFSDVILPLAPMPESEGSMVNFEGASLAFAAAVKARGEARPGWRILRRLGEALGLDGFDQVTLADVHASLEAAQQGEAADCAAPALPGRAPADGLHRIGETPMYAVDPLCRRSQPLQRTQNAQSDFLGLNPVDAARLGLEEGATARVEQAGMSAEFGVTISDRVPEGGAWLRSATCASRKLGQAFGPISVEVA
jgi:NADH-quinone oxidoreductase subunit G